MFVCGTQMGKTELVFNLLGHTLTDRPKPCLYIGPTEDSVRTQAKDRFTDMAETTPALRDAADPRSERQSTVERWYNGARCGFAWAGSGSQLRAHPAALALGDEIDAFAPIPGEGDPVQLMRARVSNYHGSTVGLFSTPLLEETSRIWKWFLSGTKERWAWQCEACGKWFVPTIEMLRWKKASEGKELQASARVHCTHCDQPYDDETRRRLAGRYIPHVIGEDGVWTALEDRPDLTVRSFWASGVVSPFRTIGRAAEELARAFRSGDPSEVQAATNTVGGEPFGLQGDTPGRAAVKDKRAVYDEPAGVRFITVGCDVQAESVYFVVRGWGVNAESWLLDYGQVHGNTEYDDVWIALVGVLESERCGMVSSLTLIDSGYRAPQVYAFARRTPNVCPSKGRDTLSKPHHQAFIDESPRGRLVRSGIKLFHIHTDYWKQWVYGRIRWPAGTPGDWHVPETVSDDYCEQVTNEIRTVIKGKPAWKTTGSRQNHFLDCEVNAAVAASVRNVSALRKLPDPTAKVKSETLISHSRQPVNSFRRRSL